MDLVIDADVMRSASEKEHPISSNSREVLELVRDRGHRVVHSQRIFEEHKKHESRYSSTWRVSMIATGGSGSPVGTKRINDSVNVSERVTVSPKVGWRRHSRTPIFLKWQSSVTKGSFHVMRVPWGFFVNCVLR